MTAGMLDDVDKQSSDRPHTELSGVPVWPCRRISETHKDCSQLHMCVTVLELLAQHASSLARPAVRYQPVCPACAERLAYAPGRLQIDGVDEFWNTLILGDLVRARAESLDPVSDG